MNELTQQPWQKALLQIDATLEEAIRNLDRSAMQIVLVVSQEGALLGTITDGDIRRGLLRGLQLDSPIDKVLHRESFVVSPDLGRSAVLNLMRANRIHQLPVVDEDRRVVGLHLWDEVNAPLERENLMVVMAGGLGTRLRPHTETVPKPLLPVAGKPMLEHIVENAKGQGFNRFVFAVHYLGHMIEDHFGDGGRWGVRIDYLREDEPLGTAGALALLEPKPDKPFVVTNGDVLTDIRYGDLLDFHERHRAGATMAVRQHEWEHPFGVVKIQGLNIVGFEEKPVARSHINAGIYAIEPSALDVLSGVTRVDMPSLFLRLREAGHRVLAYPMHEPWLDMGTEQELENANHRAAQKSDEQ